MAIETKEVSIDNIKFYIQQFGARRSMKLEKRTISLISPLLNVIDRDSVKGEEGSALDSNIDLSKLASSIQEILTNLTDEEFEEYIFDMIGNVFFEKKAEKGYVKLPLNTTEFDDLFVGKTLTLYKLIIEVMKINNFAFFALMGGKLTQAIVT